MTIAANLDDLRTLLIDAVGATDPQSRVRIAGLFRAALTLIEEEPPPSGEVRLTPGLVRALNSMAASLTDVVDRVEFFAEEAERAVMPSPPRYRP